MDDDGNGDGGGYEYDGVIDQISKACSPTCGTSCWVRRDIVISRAPDTFYMDMNG